MKILTLIGCLFLTACTYNVDSSVAGNYTVSGNTVRNATPQVVSVPAVISTPIPVTGWAWGGGGWGGGWGGCWNGGWGTPWGYGPVVGSWNNYRYGCW